MNSTNSHFNIYMSILRFLEDNITPLAPVYPHDEVVFSPVLQNEIDAIRRYVYAYIQIQQALPDQHTLVTLHVVNRDLATMAGGIWFKKIDSDIRTEFLTKKIPLLDYERFVSTTTWEEFISSANSDDIRTYLTDRVAPPIYNDGVEIQFCNTGIDAVEEMESEHSVTHVTVIDLMHYAPHNYPPHIV